MQKPGHLWGFSVWKTPSLFGDHFLSAEQFMALLVLCHRVEVWVLLIKLPRGGEKDLLSIAPVRSAYPAGRHGKVSGAAAPGQWRARSAFFHSRLYLFLPPRHPLIPGRRVAVFCLTLATLWLRVAQTFRDRLGTLGTGGKWQISALAHQVALSCLYKCLDFLTFTLSLCFFFFKLPCLFSPWPACSSVDRKKKNEKKKSGSRGHSNSVWTEKGKRGECKLLSRLQEQHRGMIVNIKRVFLLPEKFPSAAAAAAAETTEAEGRWQQQRTERQR